MSSVRAFFRHCPSCGRRFEIRLVKKKMTDDWMSGDGEKKAGAIIQPAETTRPAALILEQGQPTPVDVELIEYDFRCKHCGHEWSEMRQVEVKEKPGTPTD